MTHEIAKQDAHKSPWTQEQVKLITNTVAKGATPDELKLFLYTASRTGLDPLTRQIHFVKRGGQMTIQTGIDGYRAIADRSGTLAGIDDAVYDSEEGAHPKKATVTVHKMVDGERVAFTASARWSEYAPQGNQAFMWQKMPYLMLAKCAEALALRKAFPNDLSGLYTNEEMQQADKPMDQVGPRAPGAPEEVDVDDVVIEAEAVETQAPMQTGSTETKKQCPHCGEWHTGKYPKCLDCWRAGKAAPAKMKTIVNEEAAPFTGNEYAK